MSKNVVIAGYYGFGNVGDEAILSGMLHDLLLLQPEINCTVVSGDPEQTIKYHNTQAVMWTDIDAIKKVVQQCDVVVIGGGGLFHDYWGFRAENVLTPWHRGLSFFGSFSLLANLYQKPYVLYAVGVGPLTSGSGKSTTHNIFSNCQLATVRDQASLENLIDIGLEKSLLPFVTADPAYRMPNKAQGVAGQTSIMNNSGQDIPLICVNLRYWDFLVDPTHLELEVAKALDTFLARIEANLIFLPFQYEDSSKFENDYAVLNRVYKYMEMRDRVVVYDKPLTLESHATIIAECKLVLAMRLHATIFALNASCPVVSLAYDQKVDSAMKTFGLEEYSLAAELWKSEIISDHLLRAYSERDHLSSELQTNQIKMNGLAKRNAEMLCEFLTTNFQPDFYKNFLLSRDFVLEKADQVVELKRQAQATEDLERQIQRIRVQAAKKDGLIEELGKGIETKNNQIQELNNEIGAKNDQLKELSIIKSSLGWKVLLILWRIRSLIAPKDSNRERILLKLKRGITKQKFRWWSRNLHIPGQMSRFAFVFDLFKREQRKRLSNQNLNSMRWPTKRGLVSVVLPVYNGADYLREAVDSLIYQTYQNWELIAINDGSIDETGDILDAYAEDDERIHVIHQENRKLPLTLSRGFSLARGEFLTWFSCDNQFAPEFIERMVDCLNRHPHWDMAYANLDIIDDSGKPLMNSDWYAGYQVPPGSEHIHLPNDPSELNILPNNYVGAAFIYRDRVAGLLGGYNPHRYTIEDYDYWMLVNGLMTLRHADFTQPVYKYRFHANSLTSHDEDLGITRDRTKLMIFDDFRRDFFLSPLAWWVEGSSVEAVEDVVRSLKDQGRCSGHYWIKEGEHKSLSASAIWYPSVYVSITDSLVDELKIPDDVPANMLKVLVITNDVSNFIEVNDDWDMCICTQDLIDPPALAHPWQGWVAIPSKEALFAAIDVRARTHHINLFEDELANTDAPELKISVVICTYQPGDRLIASIQSILNQRFPIDEFELIVVNNDPDDNSLHQQISDIGKDWPLSDQGHLRFIHCPFLGLSYARNTGMGEARGEVMCFMDDDAIADSNWLQRIWDAFEEHPMAGVIGGPIILRQPDPKPRWMKSGWKRYWSHLNPDYSSYTEVEHWWDFPWGANWCARRRALLEIGGFRTEYGRRGLDYAGGEEIIAASLIQKLGHSIAFEPQAKVHHVVAQDRFTRKHIWNTILNVRRTWFKAHRDHYFSREVRMPTTLHRVFDAINKESLFITLAELNAELHLLIWRLDDWLLRFRQPLSKR